MFIRSTRINHTFEDHRIDIEPRCVARHLAHVAHSSRLRGNPREARRPLVPSQPSSQRAIPASHHALGPEAVNKTGTITTSTLQQLWRGLGIRFRMPEIIRLGMENSYFGVRFNYFKQQCASTPSRSGNNHRRLRQRSRSKCTDRVIQRGFLHHGL